MVAARGQREVKAAAKQGWGAGEARRWAIQAGLLSAASKGVTMLLVARQGKAQGCSRCIRNVRPNQSTKAFMGQATSVLRGKAGTGSACKGRRLLQYKAKALGKKGEGGRT